MEDIDPDHQAEMSDAAGLMTDRFKHRNVPLTLLSFLFFGGLNQTIVHRLTRGHVRSLSSPPAAVWRLKQLKLSSQSETETAGSSSADDTSTQSEWTRSRETFRTPRQDVSNKTPAAGPTLELFWVTELKGAPINELIRPQLRHTVHDVSSEQEAGNPPVRLQSLRRVKVPAGLSELC